MSKIRIALLAIALAALVVVAGCGSDEDSTSASGDSTSAASVSLSDCTPDTVETKTPGHADGGHRQARLPALLRGQRPDQRQGLRERDRLRDRRQARLHAGRGQLDRGAVQRLLRARARRTSTSTSTRSRSRRSASRQVDFSAPYYAANQAVVALKGSAARQRDLARRPRRTPTIGVQIGTTSLDAVNARSSRRPSRRSSTTPTTSSRRSRTARSTRSWSTSRRPST